MSRRYGDLLAVAGLSFRAAPGAIVGLLGPNGAGKTTTLRMICGCLGLSEGVVRIAGHDLVREPRAARAQLGYLPESPPLYLDMTVRDYVDHAARLRAVPRTQRRAAVDSALARVGLESVAGRLIAHLSKGYRQRVGLAQALVHRPAVLVLDEPTHGLDPTQMASMRALLDGLRGEHTVLLSTHLLSEVTALCDRVLILAGGKLVADGQESELRARLLAGPRVRLRLVDCAGAQTALEQLPGVDSVVTEREGLIVTLDAPDERLLAALNSEAARFGLLSSEPADTLETMFLQAVS